MSSALVRKLTNKVGNSVIQMTNRYSTQEINKIVRTGKKYWSFFDIFCLVSQENDAETITLCG